MNPILFGGATNRKRYPDGTNFFGNDYEATLILSNYAPLENPIIWREVPFPSVEQAYVAAKFEDLAVAKFISELQEQLDCRGLLNSPAQRARTLGHSRSRKAWVAAGWRQSPPVMLANWDHRKVSIMEDLVRQKFQRNPRMAEALLATGDRPLIEHTTGWNDTFWGMVDPVACQAKNPRAARIECLQGSNYLGRILMRVRTELGCCPPQSKSNERPSCLEQSLIEQQLSLFDCS